MVAARKVGFGDLQIQRRLSQGLILGEDDLLGSISINLPKAGAFASVESTQ